ncbi:MAG TPA: DUF4924 family protein [Cyclobacteriaceae bacterium]|nr:DUF4924 family protein [Cyclobacteriaceae bacterium]
MKSIAEKKKQQNISEYIIYMYQMEDLIRSYAFNIADIRQYVIAHYPITEEEKKDVSHWFEALIAQMQLERIEDSGHLSEVQGEVDSLARIHWSLLKSDADYFEVYQKAKPFVIDFVMAAEGRELGHEIQICLNGIYGLLLCRLTGKKVSEELQQSAEAFGTVLSYLSAVYRS